MIKLIIVFVYIQVSTRKVYTTVSYKLHFLTFPVELQGAQQADRFEHLSDVHLQTALQLNEEPTDLRVDLPVLWPAEVDTAGETQQSN